MTTPNFNNEMALVEYNETLCDFISVVEDKGKTQVAEDLLLSFREQTIAFAFQVLECARKKQVAALFKPPNT